MGELEGKVCVITGGAGSIGAASARRFLQAGARVMLVDRDAAPLRSVVEQLDSSEVDSHVADVGDAAATRGYVDAAVARWGALDVLFSNAGNPAVIAPLADYPEEAFDEAWRVHVRGAFLACKYGIAQMREGGSVIITSSVAGLRANPGPYDYITAKHAQVGLMRAVAKEAARRGIRVNSIHPGPTDNSFQAGIEAHLSTFLGRDAGRFFDEQIPLRRHAQPAEIAAAVLFLASAQSSFITGSTLVVDGGMSG